MRSRICLAHGFAVQHELCREDMLNGGLKGPESARVHLLNDLDNEGDQAPHAAKETAATSTSIAVDNSCTIDMTRAVAREERFAVCSTTCSTTWFARTRYKGKKKKKLHLSVYVESPVAQHEGARNRTTATRKPTNPSMVRLP